MIPQQVERNLIFFPEPQIINVNDQVQLLAFQCDDSVIQLAEIAPQASFPLHQHQESQIGMVFNDYLQMNIDGKKTIIKPLEQVYITGANIPHGSNNLLEKTILGFDVKRVVPDTLLVENESSILKMIPNSEHKFGLISRSVKGSWFDVNITQIPPYQDIPKYEAELRTMGIVINGNLHIQIGEEKQTLTYGKIYYVPSINTYKISNLT